MSSRTGGSNSRKPKVLSKGEETLALHLRALKIPFKREVRFHPTRKWRFDFTLPGRLAIEVQGGVGAPGVRGHGGARGYAHDCEKLAEAVILGWRVLYVTTRQVTSGQAIGWIQRALLAGGGGRVASKS